MNILSINYPLLIPSGVNVVNDYMMNVTPFGYDVIICNPSNSIDIVGNTNEGYIREVLHRWHDYLIKWMDKNHLLIVIMQPYIFEDINYHWFPFNSEIRYLHDSGKNNSYLGKISSNDYVLKDFLNSVSFKVNTYYKCSSIDEEIIPLSYIDDELITSFTLKSYPNIIFIPSPKINNQLFLLIYKKLSTANIWQTEKTIEIKKRIEKINNDLTKIEEKKKEVLLELQEENNKINKMIQTDIYLSKSTNLYTRLINKDNPDPEDYYEAVEYIEKAFGSEHTMRNTLNLSKQYIDELMRRTNEFRHARDKDNIPHKLTNDEITNFNSKLETIIKKYLEYLLLKYPNK